MRFRLFVPVLSAVYRNYPIKLDRKKKGIIRIPYLLSHLKEEGLKEYDYSIMHKRKVSRNTITVIDQMV